MDPFKELPHSAPFAEKGIGWGQQRIVSFVQDEKGKKSLEAIDAELKKGPYPPLDGFSPSSWVVQALNAAQHWWQKEQLNAYHPPTDTGTLRTLTLREGKGTGDKMVVLTVSENPHFMINRSQIEGFKRSLLAALPGKPPSLFLRIQRIGQKREKTFYEIHLCGPDCLAETLSIGGKSYTFKLSPSSPFHLDSFRAESVYAQALALSQPKPSDTVLDLCVGTAVLSLVFSPHVKTVIGVEKSAYARCDAERNIRENRLSNISLFKEEVCALISRLSASVDLAILNPSRLESASHMARELLDVSPKAFLYFSSSVREEEETFSILERGGYRVRALHPVDPLFYGRSLKNIAVLEKKKMRYT